MEEGARVAFAGRDQEKGRAVELEAKALDGDARFFRCDLSDEQEVEELIGSVRKWGRLNCRCQ
ncbi:MULTISPECIES: SDR family oxidoreductase [unclassified Mesorhizobium]|uniref:SDR family oxidoreductase n=1 Tax=unclassified Mesorhizobium TaxID=325217 RepID=UPI0033385115